MTVDRLSREVLSDCWSRDSEYVYSCDTRVKNADPQSFTVLNEHYAVDRERVYTPHSPITEADRSSFRTVGPVFHWFNVSNAYAADESKVYHTEFLYKARVLKTATPKSFRALTHGYGADEKNVYWGWKQLPGAAPADWEFVGGPHSRSGKNAYCFAKKVKGADGRTLTSLPVIDSGEYWCRTDSSFYNWENAGDGRDYLKKFADCFIFIGRVVNIAISDKRRESVPLDNPNRWILANHMWLDVKVSSWLQKPNVVLASPLIDSAPIRFGEGMHFHELSDESWLGGDRIWILKPVQSHRHVQPHLVLEITGNWWESSRLSNLELIDGLIKESRMLAASATGSQS